MPTLCPTRALDILIHNAAKMKAGSVFKGFDH